MSTSFRSIAQAEQPDDMGFCIVRDPSIVDLSNGDRVEVVTLGATDPFDDDQVRLFEDAQMFHHTESGHVGCYLAQFGQGLAVVRAEGIEQGSAVTIGQRLEDRFEKILHDSIM
jgi:hypothetical protein